MLALAQSALNKHYAEVWDEATIEFHGSVELTSYGDWLCGLTGATLLNELNPWANAFELTEDEVDTQLWLIAGVPIPAPPPPAQLELF